jgi:leucyl aminopeptidase
MPAKPANPANSAKPAKPAKPANPTNPIITKITVGSHATHKAIIIPLITQEHMPIQTIKKLLTDKLGELSVSLDSNHDHIIAELVNTLHKSPKATFSMFGSEGKELRALYFTPIFIDSNLNKTGNSFEIGRRIDVFRNAGAECAMTLNHNAIRNFNLKMLDYTESYAFLEGLLLALYRFNKYKTTVEPDDSFTVAEIHLLLRPSATQKEQADVMNHCNKLMVQTRAVYMARDLINEPANHRRVVDFIATIKSFIKTYDIPVNLRVIDTKELKRMGMNLMVSVGNASIPENSSRLLILETRGNSSEHVDYVLIGKGVMFDTGGLNIKANDDELNQEKTDMAGAGIIASFILGYAKLGGSKRIVGLLALSQNDISARGTHSGDILKSYNGMTVEITNTDAEGRLLLADCLAYADEKYNKSLVLDMATLTGDQAYMSCKVFSSVISRHPALVARLVNAGNLIQERILESPYVEEFREYLNSSIADIKNIGDSSCRSDTIIAGVFLGQFIKPTTQWAHLDIAGISYGMNERKAYYPAEGSAIGVRLLFEVIDNHTELNSRKKTKKTTKQ